MGHVNTMAAGRRQGHVGPARTVAPLPPLAGERCRGGIASKAAVAAPTLALPRKRERECADRWTANKTSREIKKICVRFRQVDNKRRRAMAVQALGYAGFGSAALDDWRQFGTGLVGLQAVERSPSLLAFRMDDRKQRIVIDRSMPDGARFFGWEVPTRQRWTRSRRGWKRPRLT